MHIIIMDDVNVSGREWACKRQRAEGLPGTGVGMHMRHRWPYKDIWGSTLRRAQTRDTMRYEGTGA